MNLTSSRPPPQRNIGNQKNRAHILLLFPAIAAAACAAQCSKAESAFTFGQESPRFALDFARRSLLDGRALPPGGVVPASHVTSDTQASWPDFFIESGLLCLQSQSAFFYENERGLRVRYCTAGAEMFSDIAAALSGRTPTIPDIEAGDISISVKSSRDLKRNGQPIVSIDGTSNQEERSLLHAGIAGSLLALNESAPLNEETLRSSLPRLFAVDSFHILVYPEVVLILYPIPGYADKWLTLSLREPGLAERTSTALQTIPPINAALVSSARAFPALVTEIYFHEQGPSAFLELASSAAEDAVIDTQIRHANGSTSVTRTFLFQGAVYVLPLDSSSSFFADPEPTAYDFAELERRGASDLRTISRDSSLDLTPSSVCFASVPCGSRGVHPSWISRPDHAGNCGIDDYTLSEWNPFGMDPGTRLDPGGKFVELMVRRDCRSGDVVFLAGRSVLDPGWLLQKAGDVLLFAADRSFFEAATTVNSSLRSLAASDQITLRRLSDQSTRVMYSPPADVTFLRGSRSGSVFRRVHSLVPDGEGRAVFHEHSATGIRPDFLASHAMSPGQHREAGSSPGLWAAEILPMGSVGTDGTHPDDEFVKLVPTGTFCQGNGFDLQITSAGRARSYRFPPPCAVEAFTVFRGFPSCFPFPQGGSVFPEIVLPNSAAEYQIRPAGSTPSDFLNITSADYSLMNAGSVRRSFKKSAGNGSWQITSLMDAEGFCVPQTIASPAAMAGTP